MKIELNHKITEKDFDKLPQLDRIEFRQKRDYLENNKPTFNPSSLFNPMFFLIGFIVLVGLGLYNINPDSAYTMFNLIPLVSKLFLFVLVIWVILSIIQYILFMKQKELLMEQYFKQEIKMKGGKR